MSNLFRIVRGGSWFYYGIYCRAALRSNAVPGLHFDGYGFRVVVGAQNINTNQNGENTMSEINPSDIGINFITLESGLEVAETMITRRQWIAVMGEGTEAQRYWEDADYKNKSMDCPVTFVTAFEAEDFAQRIGCKLPTPDEQAEYIYPLDADFPVHDHIVCEREYSDGPSPVKSLKPMSNGLYDTHGNAYEWCAEE